MDDPLLISRIGAPAHVRWSRPLVVVRACVQGERGVYPADGGIIGAMRLDAGEGDSGKGGVVRV
jgi:hypothetical protein